MENKTLSHRKSGKEEPVFDAVACSHTANLLGVRLRAKGTTEIENISSLLTTLPTLNSVNHKISIKFDRGYGKIKVLGAVGEKGYDMSTVAATVGSNHPFIASDVSEAYVQTLVANRDPHKDAKMSLFKEFVLDGNELGGPQVSVAKRKMKLSDSDKTVTVYASAIRDVHDKKVPCKDLRFFNTGRNHFINAHVWIATDKNVYLTANLLFLSRQASEARSKVETKLRAWCQPLTLTQRTGDWFLMRKFRITGTIASSLPAAQVLQEDDDEHSAKRTLLDKFNDSHHNRTHRSTEHMQQGSNNEQLEMQDWVKHVFEVGMLE